MTDEATLRKWAFNHMLDAAKKLNEGMLYGATRELESAKLWLEQASEAQQKRETEARAAATLAAYTDLADAA